MGSNLGNKKHYINSALSALRNEKSITVERISPVICTKPVGKTDQPDFLNCVVECNTEMSPHELIGTLFEIEKKLGRVRHEKWGPRTIDLDILFFDKKIIDTDDLCIPHPEFVNRIFLLQLMNEIAPKFIHPALNISMENLYERN